MVRLGTGSQQKCWQIHSPRCTELILISKLVTKRPARGHLTHEGYFAAISAFRINLSGYDTTPCRATGIFIIRAVEIAGKMRHFGVYLLCGLFDTLENRVITSGLSLASFLEAFWVFQPSTEEP